MAVNDATPETREDLYDEEYRRKGILVYKFRPLKKEFQAQVETDSAELVKELASAELVKQTDAQRST